MPTFLHVGCGTKLKEQTTRGFNTADWRELRFDIDASKQPDIMGTMLDMSAVASESVDALYSAHNIEHLYPHEVPLALAEFRRVIKPDGFVVITCPDLQSVCAMVAEDQLDEAVYQSPNGGVAPLDILYGFRPSLARGNLYMAHKTGFTQKTLTAALIRAGFTNVASLARGRAPVFDLWALATRTETPEPQLRALALAHFPGQSPA